MALDDESLNSEADITIIENVGVAGPSNEPPSPPIEKSPAADEEVERLRVLLRRAMLDREKLELQNEQLLRQWEEALEYVSQVQRQLQDELNRCCDLKEEVLDQKRRHQDMVCVSRDFAQFLGIFAVVLGIWLYLL